MERNDIQKLIDDSIAEVVSYSTKKLGDTPNDALQLTPKKYVDAQTSILSSILSDQISSTISGIAIDQISSIMPADETIGAFKPVRATKSATLVYMASSGTGLDNGVFGGSAAGGIDQIGVRFNIPTGGGEVTSIPLTIQSVGSPVDAYLVQIEGESGIVPDGGNLGHTSSIASATISSVYTSTPFTFSTGRLILPGGDYWAVLIRTGSRDSVNYVNFRTSGSFQAAPPIGNGSFGMRINGTWSTFRVGIPAPSATVARIGGNPGAILMADSSTVYSSNVIGITTSSVVAGLSTSVVMFGLTDGLSGLSTGDTYYLNGNDLATTPGTVVEKVGSATTTTKFLVNPDIQ